MCFLPAQPEAGERPSVASAVLVAERARLAERRGPGPSAVGETTSCSQSSSGKDVSQSESSGGTVSVAAELLLPLPPTEDKHSGSILDMVFYTVDVAVGTR